MILSTRLIASADVTWSTINGSISADNAALTDRSPANKVALTWSSGVQTTASTVSLIADCDVTPRMVALLGVDLPSGLKVELWGKRVSDLGYTYDLGGNSQSQRTVTFDDGSVGAVWVLADGLDAIKKLEVRIFNDVAGSTAIAASASHQIGEIVIAEAQSFQIKTGWGYEIKETRKSRRTLAAQVDSVARPFYRVVTVTPIPISKASTFGSAGDWSEVCAKIASNPFVFAVVDETLVQETSVFGIVTKIPSPTHWQCDVYQPQELVIEKIPS